MTTLRGCARDDELRWRDNPASSTVMRSTRRVLRGAAAGFARDHGFESADTFERRLRRDVRRCGAIGGVPARANACVQEAAVRASSSRDSCFSVASAESKGTAYAVRWRKFMRIAIALASAFGVSAPAYWYGLGSSMLSRAEPLSVISAARR
jgi:hypothetical protein